MKKTKFDYILVNINYYVFIYLRISYNMFGMYSKIDLIIFRYKTRLIEFFVQQLPSESFGCKRNVRLYPNRHSVKFLCAEF